MAGPLRRVSQNYKWTLKRAHNDLHNSITPDLQVQPTPASSNIDTIVIPWDSARLQWKFKSEYNELRDHLEHSLLILLGWWMTLTEQFIAQPEQAIFSSCKQCTKLVIHVACSISLWGLLTAFLQYAVPRVAFPHNPSLSLGRLFGPFPMNRPVQSPNVKSTTHARPGPEGSIPVMSDPARSVLDVSLMVSLKDGIEKKGWPFPGNSSLMAIRGNPMSMANEIA
ncbi:hypothetical protein EI94DRAFT_1751208, partial [Lactarius quietus]